MSYLHLNIDPHGPHREGEDECNWWHGGICDCHPGMIRSRAVKHHCHECNYVNSHTGSTACNCNGRCICDREEDCPCVENGLAPRVEEVE